MTALAFMEKKTKLLGRGSDYLAVSCRVNEGVKLQTTV